MNEVVNRSSEPTPSPQGAELTLESSTLYLLEKNLCEKLGVFTRLEELCCRVERMWLEDKTGREHTAALFKSSPLETWTGTRAADPSGGTRA